MLIDKRTLAPVAHLLTGLALTVGATAATASTNDLENFESGLPATWTSTGSWSVGGPTGSGVTITAPQGSAFLRSGSPNTLESSTGTITSGAYTVTHDTLEWLAVGWSGQFGNGDSRFEVLNSSQAVIATVAAPLSDSWQTQSVSLLTAGLSYGDTFYFRAVDGNSANGYAWLAMDDLKLVGAVPEPETYALMLAGLGVIGWSQKRRRQG